MTLSYPVTSHLTPSPYPQVHSLVGLCLYSGAGFLVRTRCDKGHLWPSKPRIDYHKAQRITFELVSSLPLEFIRTLITNPHEAD